MCTRCPSVGKAVLLSFALVLSGCSLKSGDVSQSLHLDLSKLSSARTGAVAAQQAITGTSSYACLGVSVSGLEIADSPGLQCGHPGIVAGPLSTSITAVDLMVPTGLARKVTVFGITDASLCSTFDANSLQAAKSLGSSAEFDFFDDASVSVKLDFNGATAFPNCNPSAAPVNTFHITNGLPQNPKGIAIDNAQDYLYVVSNTDSSISKFKLSTGDYIGSIGKILTSPTGGAAGCAGAAVGTAAPGWCTGGTFNAGTGNGMFNSPSQIAIDGNGHYLYVADTASNRIVKVDASSGSFQGWIGNISSSPTGGAAGCNGASVSSFTPGWCTGGSANSGSSDGMMYNPTGVALDVNGNIFVADTNNHRINKYNSLGAFQGWIGYITTSPTGGASGCSGATPYTFTPGWCLGGTAGSGSNDGMMSGPQGIAIDSSNNLYVADSGNNRINKYNSSNGTFLGWVGKIATATTGGATGCSIAAVGNITPGWCTGGTSTFGSADGALYSPAGVAIDTSGNLYVADRQNNRVAIYNSNGEFKGWSGKIATSPTSGAAGCSGAAVGSITPGWCLGGTAISGSTPGSFTNPSAVSLDSLGHLFVGDTYQFQRFF